MFHLIGQSCPRLCRFHMASLKVKLEESHRRRGKRSPAKRLESLRNRIKARTGIHHPQQVQVRKARTNNLRRFSARDRWHAMYTMPRVQQNLSDNDVFGRPLDRRLGPIIEQDGMSHERKSRHSKDAIRDQYPQRLDRSENLASESQEPLLMKWRKR